MMQFFVGHVPPGDLAEPFANEREAILAAWKLHRKGGEITVYVCNEDGEAIVMVNHRGQWRRES